jgi:hypothetical protein
MWTRVGGDYTFGMDGSPNPPIEYTNLPNSVACIGDGYASPRSNGTAKSPR